MVDSTKGAQSLLGLMTACENIKQVCVIPKVEVYSIPTCPKTPAYAHANLMLYMQPLIVPKHHPITHLPATKHQHIPRLYTHRPAATPS